MIRIVEYTYSIESSKACALRLATLSIFFLLRKRTYPYFRVTITAVCLVVVTFAILALGISLVLFRNCGRNVHTELNCEATEDEAEELMELVPHITLNPSFNIDMLEYIEAEVSPTDACERTNLVQVASNDAKNLDVDLL